MQQVYTARDEMDANFLRGLLVQEEIEAIVQGEALQEAWGDLNLRPNSLPSVWVRDEDVARAMPIVEEYRQRDVTNDAADDQPPRATWTCPNCGETVEEQFSQCWHCGHQRPTGAATTA